MHSVSRFTSFCLRIFALLALCAGFAVRAQTAAPARERLLMDFGWKFSLGHADPAKDLGAVEGTFSYFAKAGFAAGAAAPKFDDAAWRSVDLPHDWAVELPFDAQGTGSHGFKALGPKFPANSIGWYRKTFVVPASDLGRRISLEFDGVFRDSVVWVNGHYLGRESSGYAAFDRNISEILNYGGENVVVVRVDATHEEGWFYEGAGIYRHVWLVKTNPVHVARDGTYVTTELRDGSAEVTVRATVQNEGRENAALQVRHVVLDADGREVAQAELRDVNLPAGDARELSLPILVKSPRLWSIDTPHVYQLVTTLHQGGKVTDEYRTPFGIRTIHFDANQGFLLNGQRVQLKGTNNHQDHAGVGVALPDALIEFRLRELKKMGVNAYRVSHHPASAELLDLCDRLGLFVIDENRLMGTTDYHYDLLERMIQRDRNHPSIILWSIGNEEWRIEGADQGARVTATMQARVKRLDPTRPVTVAISGGWGGGNSTTIEVGGVNYIGNGDPDQQHARRPEQPLLGTEESAFNQTRGIYVDDRERCHLRAYDWDPSTWGSSAEQGWSFYAARPWLAGMFVWTGFDYRGEPTPFGWPAISSQFGILDTCGFPKDVYHYYRAWWTNEPVLHVFPHWNWAGREGQQVDVWAFSNCDEVELFLNGKSLGRQAMKPHSHLEWKVAYAPGELTARGFRGGQEVAKARVETTGAPAGIKLQANRATINADGEDVCVVTVQVVDAQGRVVPTANVPVQFSLNGPAKIIGVGNGDPSSHEPDVFVASAKDATAQWKRSTFNGYAQLLFKSVTEAGKIQLVATAPGLTEAKLDVTAAAVPRRAFVP